MNRFHKCDKCSGEVLPHQDARHLEAVASGKGMIVLMTRARHLFPVTKGNKVICEGSPSRAQYLPGQARDMRGVYAFNPKRQAYWRRAYKKLQKQYSNKSTVKAKS